MSRAHTCTSRDREAPRTRVTWRARASSLNYLLRLVVLVGDEALGQVNLFAGPCLLGLSEGLRALRPGVLQNVLGGWSLQRVDIQASCQEVRQL